MMRTLSLFALGVLASSAAFGAPRPETTTYVDGNLKDVSPNTGGTLQFAEDKTMYFNTGVVSIPVPYASITKAELGATKTHSHDVPLYKVWALHKRLTEKTQTQYLTVGFKNAEGEDQSMTLELAQSVAPDVLSTIQNRSGLRLARSKSAADPNAWWGDEFWKTARNADKWNKTVADNAH